MSTNKELYFNISIYRIVRGPVCFLDFFVKTVTDNDLEDKIFLSGNFSKYREIPISRSTIRLSVNFK